MKIGAIVQARMGSTRLPGKVLADICGATMLARTVYRTQQAAMLDSVIVATSTETEDDAVLTESEAIGVEVFRGSEQDVLDRYYQAARYQRLDVIVRITADCPLIDPGIIDRVVTAFVERRPDYASNVLERTYPRGLDTECIDAGALGVAWALAKEPYQRTHVTPFFYENPDQFRLVSVKASQDLHGHRWTVDTAADLEFVRAVYGRLMSEPRFSWYDVLAITTEDPGLAELNAGIEQKRLQEG